MEMTRAGTRPLLRASQTGVRAINGNTSRKDAPYHHCKPRQMDDIQYECRITAEPLHRYRYGGYHPLELGDALKDGRYKILHKLGWGGYSTVWAARDLRSYFPLSIK